MLCTKVCQKGWKRNFLPKKSCLFLVLRGLPTLYALRWLLHESVECTAMPHIVRGLSPRPDTLPSRMEKYAALNHEGKNSLTQVGREQGIRRLMSINLLKRLESSVHSFLLTIKRIQDQICSTLDTIARRTVS